MIISCPECAGPFEVPDDRIAALVQVACPHCAFRMILDFAAANDAGLVEEGMRMASGFRSAADYHASLQAPAVAVVPEPEPEVAPEPEPEVEPEPVAAREPVAPQPVPSREPPPRRVRPERIVATEPPVRARPEPVSPAPSSPRPATPAPTLEPVRPAASVRPEPSEEARTEVHMLPRGAERRVPVDIPPVRRPPPPRAEDDDIAVTVPGPATEIVRPSAEPAADEVAIDFDDEPEPATTVDTPPLRRDHDQAHPAFGSEEDEDVPTMVVGPEAREAAQAEMEALAARRRAPEAEPRTEVAPPPGRERPRPPHTPPGRAKVTTRDDETPSGRSRPEPRPAEDEVTASKRPKAVDAAPIDDDEPEQERMSTFGVVVVVLLLVLSLGLVGASIALNPDHSPDPRPLLEKLYRTHVKGEPAAPPADAAPSK